MDTNNQTDSPPAADGTVTFTVIPTGPIIVCNFMGSPQHDWSFHTKSGEQFGLVQWRSGQSTLHTGGGARAVPFGAVASVSMLAVAVMVGVLLGVLAWRRRH